jgi:transcriptional regulator of acetoin/glycerol metabolism
MPARTPAVPRRPGGPFFATPEQRAALARERFFDDGVRPSGLVPETVIQSWSRCVGARRQPHEAVAFDPITKARIASALQRNRLLLEAAREDLGQLDAALAGTSVKAMLTSHDGVVVHATPIERHEGALLPMVARVGVDIGELSVGTGAPGVAARTGEVCVVRGSEHFFSCMSPLYCAAAPIRDARGDVAAVLDLSSEAEMFRFDAAAMVQLYATAIENRLLAAQARSQLLLRFQASPTLLHTPLEGLAAVGEDGRVAWLNGTGASLLGCERVPAWNAQAGALFGLDVEALLVLMHEGRARPQRLPSGLTLWMQASLDGRAPRADEPIAAAPAAVPEVPAMPPPATLRDANRHLIEQTLTECKGNVSRTARCLGVSRGLLYRRLRAWGLA